MSTSRVPPCQVDCSSRFEIGTDNDQFKLCDFGSAGPVILDTKLNRQAEIERIEKTTTALYRAPELADIDGLGLFGSGKIDEKVDIWALGCIIYFSARTSKCSI